MSRIISKEKFDEIIKRQIVEKYGETQCRWNENYDKYYNKDVFTLFTKEMQKNFPSAYQEYGAGKGSELNQKKVNDHIYPPKMASVASSSRFCYLALRYGAKMLGLTDLPRFEFPCPIAGINQGTPPQLDACFPVDSTYIEVKCHEIFDHHRIEMKEKYWNRIYSENNDFGFEPRIANDDFETFMIPLSEFDIEKEYSMFDIKQLLCHLMGISCDQNESRTLVYLFFMPMCSDEQDTLAVNNVFRDLSAEIKLIFNSKPIVNFCRKHNIKLMAIAEHNNVMDSIDKCQIIDLMQ